MYELIPFSHRAITFRDTLVLNEDGIACRSFSLSHCRIVALDFSGSCQVWDLDQHLVAKWNIVNLPEAITEAKVSVRLSNLDIERKHVTNSRVAPSLRRLRLHVSRWDSHAMENPSFSTSRWHGYNFSSATIVCLYLLFR